MAEKRWIAETLFDELGVRISYRIDKLLYETKTEHQHLVLFKQAFFGKMLMIDGATQISAKDEFIYQEMMSHVPLFAHGKAREVLIVGGGDCGIAEEVLKHRTVKRVTQVEIDVKVVEFAREHFPEITRPVFADPRFESVIGDGAKYVALTDRRFDVVIVDFNGPTGSWQGSLRPKILPLLQTLLEQRWRRGDAKRRADVSATRVHVKHRKTQPAVCGHELLRCRHSNLCWWSHGDGFRYH